MIIILGPLGLDAHDDLIVADDPPNPEPQTHGPKP